MGNRSTSLIEGLSVRSITKRSTPTPRPPVGGIPCSRAAGDKNVYFVDGISFNAIAHQYETTVDGVHPNDFGFVRMAEGIGATIRHALEKLGN